jgi:hypothetical protein
MLSGWLQDTAERRHNGLKKSSPQFEVGGEHYEYHWYEHPEIGRFETKQLRVKRP